MENKKSTSVNSLSVFLTAFSFLGIGIFVFTIGRNIFFRKLPAAFDSPDAPGSGKCMDRRLILLLKKLEKLTSIPVFSLVSSGARTPEYNKKVGGVKNSSHLIPVCKAVDLKTPNKAIRNRLVQGAKVVGFKRIGVGNTFIHLDVDESKRQYVAWGYPAGSAPPINPFV